jgi:hypothetical protein
MDDDISFLCSLFHGLLLPPDEEGTELTIYVWSLDIWRYRTMVAGGNTYLERATTSSHFFK